VFNNGEECVGCKEKSQAVGIVIVDLIPKEWYKDQQIYNKFIGRQMRPSSLTTLFWNEDMIFWPII